MKEKGAIAIALLVGQKFDWHPVPSLLAGLQNS